MESGSVVILVIFCILCVAFIITFIRSKILNKRDLESLSFEQEKEFSEHQDDSYSQAEIDSDDFSKEFFERTQNGEPYQVFMRIASNQDCYMLQSLLYSAGIPSYTEFEHVSGIFGSTAGLLNSVFVSRLSVLCSDYDEAYLIAKDFIKQKSDSFKEKDTEFEVEDALALIMAPYPITSKQTVLGLTVYPKKN